MTLGDFYFKEGRYRESAESYLRAIAYAPEDAPLHFVLADALIALSDYHYAAFIIKKAVRLDSAMVFAEADKRDFYGDDKIFAKHMAELEKYVADKPFDEAALLTLGYNLKFSKQPEKAIITFEKVLKISPENETAKLFLEALRTKVDDGAKAGKKSLEKSPDSKAGKKPSTTASSARKAITAPKTKPAKKINDSGDA